MNFRSNVIGYVLASLFLWIILISSITVSAFLIAYGVYGAIIAATPHSPDEVNGLFGLLGLGALIIGVAALVIAIGAIFGLKYCAKNFRIAENKLKEAPKEKAQNIHSIQ